MDKGKVNLKSGENIRDVSLSLCSTFVRDTQDTQGQSSLSIGHPTLSRHATPPCPMLMTQKSSCRYNPSRVSGDSGYSSSASHATYPPSTSTTQSYQAGASTSLPRYDPYAPPRRPVVNTPAPVPPATPVSSMRISQSPRNF